MNKLKWFNPFVWLGVTVGLVIVGVAFGFNAVVDWVDESGY